MRIVNVEDAQQATVATYAYDALGRRIIKSVGRDPAESFCEDGNRVIEHHADIGLSITEFRAGRLACKFVAMTAGQSARCFGFFNA